MTKSDPVKKTWDEYWSRGDPGYTAHKEIVDRAVRFTRGDKDVILEIGAGAGVDAIEIALAGRTVIALDMSDESLKLIRSKAYAAKARVLAVRGDALYLPFKSGSVDLIYHQGVLEHFRKPDRFLAEQRRTMKTTGRIIADVPQTFTLYTIKKKISIARGKWFAGWETQYTPHRLKRTLEQAGFQAIDAYGWGFDFRGFLLLDRIDTLGKNRFGHPVIPRFLRNPIGRLWRRFERSHICDYLRFSIGIVAGRDENRD